MRTARRFFFYGTLIAGLGGDTALAAHQNLRPLGEARVKGRLIALPDRHGWYPALIPGTGRVRGELYETIGRFGAADIARLDHYEGHCYRRINIPVAAASGISGMAQTYLWHGARPAGAVPIQNGDFPVWLAETGLLPFSG